MYNQRDTENGQYHRNSKKPFLLLKTIFKVEGSNHAKLILKSAWFRLERMYNIMLPVPSSKGVWQDGPAKNNLILESPQKVKKILTSGSAPKTL
jgi:hypothetical protein